jgi:PilZ domain
MRFGRGKAPASTPVQLPGKGENVTLSTSGGGRIPARVMESGADSLTIAITVPTRPLSAAQLENLLLEYVSPRGRLRLRGTFAQAEGGDPDLLQMLSPRSVEVVQQRSYVRIEAARPVIVYSGATGSQMQSFTVDISGGGFQLAGPDTLSIGDEIRFRLTLTPGVAPVTGTAKVVRVTPQGRRAVEFESISDLDRRRLVRFIFESQRGERSRGLGQGD